MCCVQMCKIKCQNYSETPFSTKEWTKKTRALTVSNVFRRILDFTDNRVTSANSARSFGKPTTRFASSSYKSLIVRKSRFAWKEK